jgi:hypothetical protein
MERTEVNCQTGEIKVIQLTAEEIAALPIPVPPTKADLNAPILAALAAADLKILRALVEGDTVRIAAHNTAQDALRATLLK